MGATTVQSWLDNGVRFAARVMILPSPLRQSPAEQPIELRVLSLWVKRPGSETVHSLPTSAEVMNTWNFNSTPLYISMAWCLIVHRDNFTYFTLLYDDDHHSCITISIMLPIISITLEREEMNSTFPHSITGTENI
jgi:hypothetical protein